MEGCAETCKETTAFNLWGSLVARVTHVFDELFPLAYLDRVCVPRPCPRAAPLWFLATTRFGSGSVCSAVAWQLGGRAHGHAHASLMVPTVQCAGLSRYLDTGETTDTETEIDSTHRLLLAPEARSGCFARHASKGGGKKRACLSFRGMFHVCGCVLPIESAFRVFPRPCISYTLLEARLPYFSPCPKKLQVALLKQPRTACR